MRAATYVRFAQSRIFWQLRQLLKRFRFEVLRFYFRIRRWAQERTRDSGLLVRFLRAVIGQLLFASLIAGLIWLTEVLIGKLGGFASWKAPEVSAYASFMETVAQIGGVFIALYYTALVSVAATVFAKAPSQIRNLYVGERTGSLYMRYVAYATFLPLALVALTFTGVPPFHLGVPSVVVLAAIAVFIFVHLGQQAFNFFDPTVLAAGALDQFLKAVDELRPGGFRWLETAFQDNSRLVATESLEAVAALYDICFNSPHLAGRPLSKLVNQTLWTLSRYQTQKSGIPPKSYWFERTFTHPSWYLLPDYSLEIPQRTGTAAQPEVGFDYWWVEKRVEPLLLQYLQRSLRPRADNSATDFLGVAANYLSAMVSQFQLSHAVDFLEKIGNEIAESVTVTADGPDSQNDLRLAALGEYYGTLATGLLLGFARSTESLKSEKVCPALADIDWSSEKAIYTSGLPGFLTPRLEWLKERAQFELAVEGRRLTTAWYQEELVNQSIAERLKEDLPLLFGILRRTSVLPQDFVPNDHQVFFIAGLLRARWEFLRKLPYHLAAISGNIEAAKRPKILSDLPWLKINLEEYEPTIRSAESDLVIEMATTIARMVGKTRPENLPDYRGQFLHNLAEASLAALSKNDAVLLKQIFPIFFVGSMSEFDALRPQPSSDPSYATRIQAAMAPILDLMEISGQALTFAELHGNEELWNTAKRIWDKYIESMPNSLTQLSIILNYGNATFSLSPHGMVRFSWSQALSQRLAGIPGAADGLFTFSNARHVDHGSALIRYLASRAHIHGELGGQVFVSLYLSKRPGASGVDWGRQKDERISRVFDEKAEENDDEED
jgi:hypothetical protein